MNDNQEEVTRTLYGDIKIIRTEPYGFWRFKKLEGGVNVPDELKSQQFTDTSSAERAYQIYRNNKAPLKKDK